MSLSLLCKPGYFELLCVNRQQIAIDAQGRVSFEGVAIDSESSSNDAFRRVARDVVQAIPGLRGFVGIDLVMHETRGPVVIEVNPRVSSTRSAHARGRCPRCRRHLCASLRPIFRLASRDAPARRR